MKTLRHSTVIVLIINIFAITSCNNDKPSSTELVTPNDIIDNYKYRMIVSDDLCKAIWTMIKIEKEKGLYAWPDSSIVANVTFYGTEQIDSIGISQMGIIPLCDFLGLYQNRNTFIIFIGPDYLNSLVFNRYVKKEFLITDISELKKALLIHNQLITSNKDYCFVDQYVFNNKKDSFVFISSRRTKL